MSPLVVNEGKNTVPNGFVYETYPLNELIKLPDGIKWLMYLHNHYYPNIEENPFFLLDEYRKDKIILRTLGLKEEDKPEILKECISLVKEIYSNPIIRLHESLKNSIDKIARYLEETEINDRNMKNIESVIKNFNVILESYKKTLTSINEAFINKSQKVKGGKKLPYDL